MQFIVTIVLILISLGKLDLSEPLRLIEEPKEPEQIIEELKTEDLAEKEIKEEETVKKLPATFDLKVPFQSQAPHGNWDLPYQEACEEAALIQAKYYFDQKDLTDDQMDEEILKLVEWEKLQFGLYSDTELVEVKIMAEDYFGLNVEISDDVSVENLKKQLAEGNLIIAPAAGRELGNQYFTGEGPIFHVVVIRGYDRNEFIVNDVGTRHGEKFKYKYNTLISAIHDLPIVNGQVYRPFDSADEDELKGEKMLTGLARILIVKNSFDTN